MYLMMEWNCYGVRDRNNTGGGDMSYNQLCNIFNFFDMSLKCCIPRIDYEVKRVF